MAKTTGKSSLRTIREAFLRNRGSAFAYMLENYQSIKASKATAGGRFKWQDIADALAALGLTDSRGKPPSAKTVQRTWTSVCRVVAVRNKRLRPRVKAKDPAPGIIRDAADPAPDAPRRLLPAEPYAAPARLFDRSQLKMVREKNPTTKKPEDN